MHILSTLRIVLGAVALLALPCSLWAQTGIVRGTVTDLDGEPLVGATVYIPALQAGAYTNESGIFSIDKLQPGQYDILAFYFGYDTLRQDVTVDLRGATTIGFALSERSIFANEVEIVGQKTGEIQKTEVNIGVTSISAPEIKLIPSLGSADLAQFLQVLPGVVFTGDQGGQLYIRGGTPIQNMVLLDEMVIYSPFHSIGLFSVFDPDYIRSVEVHSAAFPGQYGGRTSSVIDIKTRNGSVSKFKAKLNANPFSTNALVEGPLVKGKAGAGVSYLLSARNNYIDQTSPTLYSYINDGQGLPYNYLDLYGKLTLTDGVNNASVFGFSHQDNVNLEFPADIGWDSYGGGGNFQLLPSGASAIVSGSFAYSNYETSLRSQSETFPRRSSINGFNGTLKLSYIINRVDEFSFGTSFLGFSTDYVFTNSFGFRTQQNASNTEAAVFLLYKKVFQQKMANGKTFERAVIEPSLHFHYYNNQSRVLAEPRLRAKLNFPGLSFSFGTGLYSQNLLAAVSDRDVVNLFQGFLSAPEDLAYRIRPTTLQYAWHALTGVELELVPNLTTNVEAWYKGFPQLTNINRDKIFNEDPNFITETGEAYGLDLILKYNTRDLYFYSNYSLARVTRTDRLQTDDPRTYAPIFDRRHTVNVVLAYKNGDFGTYDDGARRMRTKFDERKWEFSVRWSLGSGFPFTQTQGYFEKLTFNDNGAQTDLATQNGQLGLILSSDLNAGRLPYYHRLDASVRRRWILRNSILVEADASVVNAYNRQNIFYFDRIRFAAVYQLPIVPSLGLTLKY